MLSAINTWWEILRGSFQKHNLFAQKVWAYFTAIIYDIFTKETVQNLPYIVSSVFVLQTRSENNLKRNKLNYKEKFESKRLYARIFLLLRMDFFSRSVIISCVFHSRFPFLLLWILDSCNNQFCSRLTFKPKTRENVFDGIPITFLITPI